MKKAVKITLLVLITQKVYELRFARDVNIVISSFVDTDIKSISPRAGAILRIGARPLVGGWGKALLGGLH